MNDFDEVEKKIKKILQQVVIDSNSVTKKEKNSDGWWTKAVKNGLCELAHSMNYDVTANGCDDADDKEEWLFDMVWTHKGEFTEIILAMECEWNLDENNIWDDFDKLRVVRCKYRVFIFNQYNKTEIEYMMKQFKEEINKFKSTLPGDRYLIAGYSRNEDEFIFNNILAP
jgi:hypothetical protein